jgi:hypothetical protein
MPVGIEAACTALESLIDVDGAKVRASLTVDERRRLSQNLTNVQARLQSLQTVSNEQPSAPDELELRLSEIATDLFTSVAADTAVATAVHLQDWVWPEMRAAVITQPPVTAADVRQQANRLISAIEILRRTVELETPSQQRPL